MNKDRASNKVFIVDDVESVRTDLKDGKVALEDLKVHAMIGEVYDLIFLDINMPGIDGIQLLQMLRSMDQYSKTPVFIISTENNKDSVVRAIAHGATNYILKPYSPRIVAEKILKINIY